FVYILNRIWLALKQLADKGQIDKLRFWGKIFGTQKNYFIAEAEQNVDDETDENELHEEAHISDDNRHPNEEEMDDEEDML
ncbi:unnamed protein product, partial [Rotaria socialis]